MYYVYIFIHLFYNNCQFIIVNVNRNISPVEKVLNTSINKSSTKTAIINRFIIYCMQ